MPKSFVHENSGPRSYIDIELSEHYKDAPELYLQALLDADDAAVAVLDKCGTILYVNRAWRQLTVSCGLEHPLCGVGLNYLEICGQVSGASTEDAKFITEGITHILLGRELEFQREYSGHDSKRQGRGLVHAARFDLPGDFRILVTHKWITSTGAAPEAQVTNQESLSRDAEEMLISLSGRLINAQEDERKRIARELHDDLNQRIALLSIELAQLGQQLQKPRHLRALVQNLQTKAQEISIEIHRLSYRLHPSKLDHLGLTAAVESLCEEISESHRLRIEFQQKGFPATVDKDVSLCVFRIAQESLRNCLKHSGARKAQVVLEKTEGAIHLSVTDDGCGFEMKPDAMKKGLGFTSMRERLRLVGGEMHISSETSRGTCIEISVPVAGQGRD